MSFTSNFNNKALKAIRRNLHKFYFLERDLKIKCTCNQHETSQGDPKCPKCLGTGYKIRIREILGATQESDIPSTYRIDNFVISKNFYIDSKHAVKKDDIFIDDDEIYIVVEVRRQISLEGTIPLKKAACVRKKYDANIISRNLKSIIKSKKVN